MTDTERKLWAKLRNNQMGVHFRRQVPLGRYFLDFFSLKAKLVIELDGSQHYTDEGLAKDAIRDAFLKDNGLTVLRFSDHEFLTNTYGVLQVIYEHVQYAEINNDDETK
ncbi:MAG: endonuclease domain-containing protein [Ignavibacteriales bacterium]|nr:endonuclease domain-containing protein [Ignavibacteriales bacterium]